MTMVSTGPRVTKSEMIAIIASADSAISRRLLLSVAADRRVRSRVYSCLPYKPNTCWPKSWHGDTLVVASENDTIMSTMIGLCPFLDHFKNRVSQVNCVWQCHRCSGKGVITTCWIGLCHFLGPLFGLDGDAA